MLPPRFAALDIGSNTIRLLVGERIAPTNFRPLRIERRITRLGGNFCRKRGLDPRSMERTLKAIADLLKTAQEFQAESIFAAATGVLREAGNGRVFLKQVEDRTGLAVRLLSGSEEGKLMWKGICWSLKDSTPGRLVADMGGWSTEFIWAEKGVLRKAGSVNLGVVALCEEFLRHDPPRASELLALEHHAKKVIRRVRDRWKTDGLNISRLHPRLIGTAGTMTTLAAIHLGLRRYDPEKIHHHSMTREDITRIYRHLSQLSQRERRKLPGLEKGREDLIVAGAGGVLGILEVFSLQGITVIESGLLEGILLDGLCRTPG